MMISFKKDEKIKNIEEDFLKSIDLISEDILKRYYDKLNKIGLIVLQREELPLLSFISNKTNIKTINYIQIQMISLNNKLITGYLDNNVDEFIIFGKQGRNTNLIVNELKKRGKRVLAIYSLFIDEEVKNNLFLYQKQESEKINISRFKNLKRKKVYYYENYYSNR